MTDYGEPLFIEDADGAPVVSARGDAPYASHGPRVPSANTTVPDLPQMRERIVACVNACAGIPTETLTDRPMLFREAAQALLAAAAWIENIREGRYVVTDEDLAFYVARDRALIGAAMPNNATGPAHWRTVAAVLRGESA